MICPVRFSAHAMKSGPGTSLGDFNYCLMLCKKVVSVWGGMHIGGDVEPGPIPVYPRGRGPPVPAQRSTSVAAPKMAVGLHEWCY